MCLCIYPQDGDPDLGSHLLPLNLVLLGFSGDRIGAWQVKMLP